MVQASKSTAVLPSNALGSTKMSTRRATQQLLQSHSKNAKKRRARATDQYIVYEVFNATAPSEKITRFTSGMRVEAVDSTKCWYRAEVLNVDHKKQEVLVHFVGYDHRFNQIMGFDSPLIRPAGRLESLARTLRQLDRGRAKSRAPAKQREASPPWRLPGMDVAPSSRRVRRPPEKFTVGPAFECNVSAHIAKVSKPSGGEADTPPAAPKHRSVQVKPKSAAVIESKSGNKKGGNSRKPVVNPPGRRKRSVSTAGKTRSTLKSPSRRHTNKQSEKVPASPQPRNVKPGSKVANACVTPSRSQKRPPPIFSTSKSVKVSAKPSPRGGAIKVRLCLTPKSPNDSASTPTTPTAHAPLSANRITSGGSSTADDDAFVFDFPLSPKFEKVEVKEIITPDYRTISIGNPSVTEPTNDFSQFNHPAIADFPPDGACEDTVEDISDEACAYRHSVGEQAERIRLSPPDLTPGTAKPSSPYAVVSALQRMSANHDPSRWAGLEPFYPREFKPVEQPLQPPNMPVELVSECEPTSETTGDTTMDKAQQFDNDEIEV